jgi:peptide/nickel transport system substrate-binding protein
MMSAHRKLAIIAFLILIAPAILVACGSTPEPETIIQEVTRVVEKEVAGETVVETIIEQQTVVVEIEAPTEPPVSTEPKILVVGQGQEPDSLYWYGTDMVASRHVQQALYDGPIDNRSFAYQPIILEKLPSLDDGDAVIIPVTVEAGEPYVAEGEILTATESMELEQMVVTFELKAGMQWDDGTPLTAEDSVFSQYLACHPDTPVSKYVCKRTASYEATDDFTVVWTGAPGFRDATYFTNFYTPQPKHILGDMLPAEILESDFSRAPVGYGAFKFNEWVAGQYIHMVKNPLYYRADEGLPYLDEVYFKFIPDSNQLLAQLLGGEIDIGTQDGMAADQSPFLLEAEAQGILKPVFVTGTVWEHIDFAIQPFDDRYVFFDDVRVRQAIAHGTDRQSMVDEILYGKSVVIHSFIPDVHPFYPPEGFLTTYEYDPERAARLLEEAGWVLNPDDGFRYKDGQKFQVTLNTTSGIKMREQVTQIFQQNMKDIGIDVVLEYLPSTLYFADGPDGPLFGRRYDLAEFAWLTGVEPPCDLYFSFQIPDETNAWAGQNQTGWQNPEYDEWCNKALTSINAPQRAPYFHEAQRIFSEELPVLPLFLRLKVAASRPEVRNFIMDPTENSEMWNIEMFDLEQ